MKVVIFAGGSGQRLWPISRQQSPKQFEKLKDNESTLQMAVKRVEQWGYENIYISTNKIYVDLVKDQIHSLPEKNILAEPARRDLAAAVLLTLLRLKKEGVKGTVAMLWSDHFMERPEEFRSALKKGETLLSENSNRFIFLGEKPRFANHNLGWIKMGAEIEDGVKNFEAWKYRPDILECQMMFESGDWYWNPGYFVFDIDFVIGLYKKHQKELYEALEKMITDEKDLNENYEKLPAMSFDSAIVEKTSAEEAVVLPVNLGWSDPGTLYALKEALAPSKEMNFTSGKVMVLDSKDSFIFNEENHKLVATIGLDGMMVVNTKDAILVCPKERVPEIKELLKQMEENDLTEYL